MSLIFWLAALPAKAASASGMAEKVRLTDTLTLPLEPLGTLPSAIAISGHALRAPDGRQVRLVGIRAPLPPFSDGGRARARAAEQARERLHRLLAQAGALHLYKEPDQPSRDRFGRLRVQGLTGDGVWLQGFVLAEGLGRVEALPPRSQLLAPMLALEAEARRQRRGLWRQRAFAVLAPAQTPRHIGAWVLVEGQVLDAAKVGSRVYLNFGADWRTDFTVSLETEARRYCRRAGINPLTFAGQRVRVRGWLRFINGPMLEALHCGQIEPLGDHSLIR